MSVCSASGGSKSIIPNILRKLLKARKSTRKLIVFQTVTLDDGSELSGLYSCKEVDGVETVTIVDKDGNSHQVEKSRVTSQKSTYTEFEQAVFDGLQLAYKPTANSLYGQIGAQTSPDPAKDIAASTTATGRMLLYLAKEKVEEKFEGAKIVYGDTDSIFINFNPKKKGREGLKESIHLGIQAEEYIQQFLKVDTSLNMKRHFGHSSCFQRSDILVTNMSLKRVKKTKRNHMGIVLKRRDNAELLSMCMVVLSIS